MRRLGLILVVVSLCARGAAQTSPARVETRGVAMQAVIEQVKLALARTQTRLADGGLPPLKSVTITLQTVVAKSGGPKFRLWVFSFGQTWAKEKSQEVVLVLVPPAPGMKEKVGVESLTETFEDAILSAAEGVKNAGAEPVPLKASSLSVELGFAVKSNSGLGAAVEIMPVSVEAGIDWSRTAVHKIAISFGTEN